MNVKALESLVSNKSTGKGESLKYIESPQWIKGDLGIRFPAFLILWARLSLLEDGCIALVWICANKYLVYDFINCSVPSNHLRTTHHIAVRWFCLCLLWLICQAYNLHSKNNQQSLIFLFWFLFGFSFSFAEGKCAECIDLSTSSMCECAVSHWKLINGCSCVYVNIICFFIFVSQSLQT